ncbi:MAG TPA: prohibitin family protein [Deltaproteobacteria bacterium]|nr:prohibitin family protein [Deltaproteobacteria bacterium]
MNWFKNLYETFRLKLRTNLPFFIVCVLLVLFIVFYLYNNIVYSVLSGEGGVLYKRFFGGTVVDRVYPEGIHFIFPWDKMYIYNLRIQQVPHEFDVLTKNGLKVTLNLSIRYYPERALVAVLHKVVGPEYIKTVVIPEIEHVLRVLIGQMDAEGVYTTQRSIIEKSLNEAIEKVHRRFITVDNVIIKQITLPPVVEKAIQNKIEQKHRAQAHVYVVERQQREKQRKIIEGEAMQAYNKIVQSSLSPDILQWMSIQATLELAKSENTKVIVVGGGKQGLPVFGNMILDAPGGFQFKPEDIQKPESGKEKSGMEIQKSADSTKPSQSVKAKSAFETMDESNTAAKELPEAKSEVNK